MAGKSRIILEIVNKLGKILGSNRMEAASIKFTLILNHYRLFVKFKKR